MWTRARCKAADEQDGLSAYRAHFHIPQGVIYLDGNSLGVMPKSAVARSQAVVTQEWGEDLIRSWNTAGWFDLPISLGNRLGAMLGTKEHELVITDTTSLNIYKALATAVKIQQNQHPKRRVIVSERDSFPTDLYMIQGLMAMMQQGYELRLIDEKLSLEEALNDDVAVLVLSHVNYRTGKLFDMPAINALAHAHGVLTLWDLAHSAGAVPIHLNEADADFAVGCTYKYLNGGPGSPAFIWVAAKHHNQQMQPLSGWWGHAQPFHMEDSYRPAAGIRQFLCGTQPIVSLSLVECGLDVACAVDMQAVRAKSLNLSDLFIELVAQKCGQHGLELITPMAHEARGSHVSFKFEEGFAVTQALIARGVIGDYREPHVMRFGLTPLYLGYEDIWNAVEILADILDTGSWNQPQFKQRSAVT